MTAHATLGTAPTSWGSVPGRFTAEQERDTALGILRAEGQARKVIESLPADRAPGVQELLIVRPRGIERTRAPAVNRLRAAVARLGWLALRDRGLRLRARKAQAFDREAESLRWVLAMSGKRIAYGESKKMGGPLSPEVLAQEGFLGLYRAAKRFEPSKGLRFSTYARWWVRAGMTRAIDNTGMVVRMPSGAVEQRRNIGKKMRQWDQRGFSYSHLDLASELKIDPDRVLLLLKSREGPVSLDQPQNGEDGRRLVETLTDEDALDLSTELVNDRTSRWARWALAQLPPRHRRILRLLYGLDATREFRTLGDVGAIEGVTKERIRQIRNESLEMLRDQIWRDRDGPALEVRLEPSEHAVFDSVWAGHRTTAEVVLALYGESPSRGEHLLVLRTLRTLVDLGHLVRVSRGCYQLPGESPITMGKR